MSAGLRHKAGSFSKANVTVKGNGSRKEKKLMNGITALQVRKCLNKHIAFLTVLYLFISESFRNSFCLKKSHRKKTSILPKGKIAISRCWSWKRSVLFLPSLWKAAKQRWGKERRKFVPSLIRCSRVAETPFANNYKAEGGAGWLSPLFIESEKRRNNKVTEWQNLVYQRLLFCIVSWAKTPLCPTVLRKTNSLRNQKVAIPGACSQDACGCWHFAG